MALGFLVINSLHHSFLMFCFSKTPSGPQSHAFANPPYISELAKTNPYVLQ
jgi:hypothetical protein